MVIDHELHRACASFCVTKSCLIFQHTLHSSTLHSCPSLRRPPPFTPSPFTAAIQLTLYPAFTPPPRWNWSNTVVRTEYRERVCLCVRERSRLIVVITRGRGMAGLIYTRYGQASKTEPGRFGVPYSVLLNTPITPPPLTPVLHCAALQSHPSLRRPSAFTPPPFTPAIHSAAFHSHYSPRRPSPFISPFFTLYSRPSPRCPFSLHPVALHYRPSTPPPVSLHPASLHPSLLHPSLSPFTPPLFTPALHCAALHPSPRSPSLPPFNSAARHTSFRLSLPFTPPPILGLVPQYL
jgi:hypothetical protein